MNVMDKRDGKDFHFLENGNQLISFFPNDYLRFKNSHEKK